MNTNTNTQAVGTVAPTNNDKPSTYHPALHDAILGGTFGRRASIQSLATITNSLGFTLGLCYMPRLNQQEETTFDESTATFYGIDNIAPKKRDPQIVALGFVAAQLMLVQQAMQPDPENYGKNHEWAKVYFRDAKKIAQNIHDWATARKVRQEQATLAKFNMVGINADMTTRAAAIAAEVAAMSTEVQKRVDELLRQCYIALKNERDNHEALWEYVVKAYDHIDISMTRVVRDGLKMQADAAARRYNSGGFGTIDDGVLALMKKIEPQKTVPTTVNGEVLSKTVDFAAAAETKLHIAPPANVNVQTQPAA